MSRRNRYAWRKDHIGDVLIRMKNGFPKQTQSEMHPGEGNIDLCWCPGRRTILARRKKKKKENMTFDLLSSFERSLNEKAGSLTKVKSFSSFLAYLLPEWW